MKWLPRLFFCCYAATSLWFLYQHGAWWHLAGLSLFCLALLGWDLLPPATQQRLWKPIGDRMSAPLDHMLDRWIEKERQDPKYQEFERRREQLEAELENEINPLPLKAARERAEPLLSDPARFQCLKRPPSPQDISRLTSLAPELRLFFETYESILHIKGGFSLRRSDVEPSLAGHGLFVIGSTGHEHEELSVIPGDETVHYIMQDIPEEEEPILPGLCTFTSVYHCVLYFDRKHTLLFAD
jgi:hypothetical protein